MQQALTSMAGGGGGDIKKAVSSSGFARTLKKGQGALRSATIGVARSWAQMYQFVLILLLLFIIHQLFVWIDEDPDIAFERAALLFDVAEVTWDMTRILWNGAVDILNAGVIPLWNTATYYLIEPTITLLLEVFSLIFMRQHWEGLLTEKDFPYNGLDCTATAESAAWCGRYSFYKKELEAPERAPAFADESASFTRRMMLEVPANLTFTFGLATARRLQEQSGGDFAAPAFDSGSLTTALNELAVFLITMVPSLLDIAFGILGSIIKTCFSILMDAFFLLLKSVMMVLKMLVKSGMLTVVVTIGVDFAIIAKRSDSNPSTHTHTHTHPNLYTVQCLSGSCPFHEVGIVLAQFLTEIALPGLFAVIDTLMCILDYFKPSGWNDQLLCVELTCFKGPDASADLMTFFSLPIVIGRFTSIMDATLNSRTGKRFFTAPKNSAISSKGRVRNPVSGETVDNNEPETAAMANPMYEFDFAGAWENFIGANSADECSACFTCKVPELRIIWWLVASTGSLFSKSNYNTYAGNVTQNCQSNGSWYLDACGPYGMEKLSYNQWKRNNYRAGIDRIDTRIFDSYAASIIDLNELIGAGKDGYFAEYVQAAHQWQSVDPDNMEERALVFVYHSCRNMRHEAEENALTYDQPHTYQDLNPNSVARTSSQFLYDTYALRNRTLARTYAHLRAHKVTPRVFTALPRGRCRRFKYEIFTDGGRALHGLAYQINACSDDKVKCKIRKIKCMNTCGGTDGSEYKHDFSTTVSRTELGYFALGDGFDTKAAADCTMRSYTFKVPIFRGGDSFGTFAARARVRSKQLQFLTNTHTRTHTHKHISCLTGPWWRLQAG